MNTINHDLNNLTDKEKFTLIFKELRKEGFKARQNFMCCQNCAWTLMPEEEEKENVVFYHNQDNESFNGGKNLNSKIYLAWRGNAKMIKETFEKYGYEVEWNGFNSDRIAVLPDKKNEKKSYWNN